MLRYAPAINAEAFIEARFDRAGGFAYGTLPAEPILRRFSLVPGREFDLCGCVLR